MGGDGRRRGQAPGHVDSEAAAANCSRDDHIELKWSLLSIVGVALGWRAIAESNCKPGLIFLNLTDETKLKYSMF